MKENFNDIDIKSMTFEQSLEALENIVAHLERGDSPLEESILIYERGEALKRHCSKLLRTAEDRIEKIKLSSAGEALGTEPLDEA